MTFWDKKFKKIFFFKNNFGKNIFLQKSIFWICCLPKVNKFCSKKKIKKKIVFTKKYFSNYFYKNKIWKYVFRQKQFWKYFFLIFTRKNDNFGNCHNHNFGITCFSKWCIYKRFNSCRRQSHSFNSKVTWNSW